jgi:hypothetical protein
LLGFWMDNAPRHNGFLDSGWTLRSYPFKQLPFHGKTRRDFVTFLKPYSKIPRQNLDLSKPDHFEEGVGYGRLICLFKFRTQVNLAHPVTEHHVAFLEEL